MSVILDASPLDQLVLAELRKQIPVRMAAIQQAAIPDVRDAIRQALEATPEHASLLAGRLRAEFGLANAPEVLQSVLDALQASVQVEVLPPAGDSLGGLFVGAFRDDFSDALSARHAIYPSVSAKGRETPIPWLSWFLFGVDDAVPVTQYGLFGGAQGWSRTHQFIMVRSRGKLPTWPGPSEYAGTAADNWLTRAATLAQPLVENILKIHAERYLAP